jgi:hypothetical protein
LAASTIETYQQIIDSAFIAIGFPNRVFLVPGNAERRFSIPKSIPEEAKRAIKDELLTIVGIASEEKLELEITSRGQDLYHKWYMGLEKSIHAKRLDVYALRYMSLLSINEMKFKVDEDIVMKVIQLMDWQLQIRKLYDPIDSDTKIANIEERIRRALQTGPKSERDLKRTINASRSGVWIYEQARNNLRRAKEIEFHEEKWNILE